MSKFKIYNRSEGHGATKAIHHTKSEETAKDWGHNLWLNDADITKIEIRQGKQFDYVAWIGEEKEDDWGFTWTRIDKAETAKRYVRKPSKAAKRRAITKRNEKIEAELAKRHNAPVAQAVRVAQRQASGNATVEEYGAAQRAKYAPVPLNPPSRGPRERDAEGRYVKGDGTPTTTIAATFELEAQVQELTQMVARLAEMVQSATS